MMFLHECLLALASYAKLHDLHSTRICIRPDGRVEFECITHHGSVYTMWADLLPGARVLLPPENTLAIFLARDPHGH
jgi:hypothetical protein